MPLADSGKAQSSPFKYLIVMQYDRRPYGLALFRVLSAVYSEPERF